MQSETSVPSEAVYLRELLQLSLVLCDMLDEVAVAPHIDLALARLNEHHFKDDPRLDFDIVEAFEKAALKAKPVG
ncbi:MAG: hypothetical protein CMN72_16565 [Sphingomonas sp.]|nr:hypothetical protein [Sphingomonas sp.]|tara:strand:- start:521 stop:745 length:225 start_codon:yes stop_codon:yes gene_type:complete